MQPRIAAVAVTSPYTLTITWKDGGADSIDMEGVVFGFDLFAPLRDPGVFAQVEIMGWGDGIEWPNGLDYSADSLVFQATEQREMTSDDLKAWQKAMGLSNNEAADWMGVSLSTWKSYVAPGKSPPRPVQIAAKAAAETPGLFQAHYKPRRAGRPRINAA